MASALGLHEVDAKNAKQMVDANEWGVGFDIVVTQLGEFEILVTDEFISLAREIASDMNIDDDTIGILNRLRIKDGPE